jgi:hypothetical protein
MLGLVPGIHEFPANIKTWMAGTSPDMTRIDFAAVETSLRKAWRAMRSGRLKC